VPLDNPEEDAFFSIYIMASQTVCAGRMHLLTGEVTGDLDPVEIRIRMACLALSFHLLSGIGLGESHLSLNVGGGVAIDAGEPFAKVISVVEVNGPYLYILLGGMAYHA
jgi:hypothetical protein